MWRGIGAVLGGWLVGDFWLAAWFGGFLGEPVVHSTEWTTGAALSWILAWFLTFFRELVVHSTEWTTGAGLFTDFGLVSAVA